MKYARCHQEQAEAVIRLFTKVFTDSEGAAEGELIGGLANSLMNTWEHGSVLCFTAEDDAAIVGAVFFSRFTVAGNESKAYLLSPMAVDTAYQGRGIGQQLISFGLSALKEAGTELILTYGDIRFYSKVGFRKIPEEVIRAPLPLSYPEGWLAQSLVSDWIDPIPGKSACVKELNDPAYW